MEFDKTNNSQEVHANFDDVGNKPLREVTKNMLVEAIKPKEDKDEVQKNFTCHLSSTQEPGTQNRPFKMDHLPTKSLSSNSVRRVD